MYMYYILGHKLMKLHELICVHRKAIIAQNTYLPALDGDIDLMPNAVHLVSDLMKRNANLATACGRIHPTRKDKQINNQIQIQIFQYHNQLELGLMAWYQSFVYAIGHLLQSDRAHARMRSL